MESGSIGPIDLSKDPVNVLAFRCLFLFNDGYVTSKVIKRADLSSCRRIKEVGKEDIMPVLKLASTSPEMLDDAEFHLIPSVLIQDKSGEYLLVPKSCYWW
jgi:hypothetical protein